MDTKDCISLNQCFLLERVSSPPAFAGVWKDPRFLQLEAKGFQEISPENSLLPCSGLNGFANEICAKIDSYSGVRKIQTINFKLPKLQKQCFLNGFLGYLIWQLSF